MRTLVVLAAVIAVTAPASAKELGSVTICGADTCATTVDSGRLRLAGGETTVDAPPPAAHYVLVFSDEGRTARMLYVPSHSLRAAYAAKRKSLVWLATDGKVIEQLEAASRGLEPFARPVSWPKRVPPARITQEAGFDWMLVGGLLFIAALVALVGMRLVRRGRRPRPASG